MSGKVALVTGAGSGIGKSTALAFLREGYRVVFAGRRIDRLEAAIVESGCPRAQALAVAADVTQPDAVRNLFANAVQTFGRLDVLFNNAGVFSPSVSIEDVAIEDWQSAVAVNLTAVFLCTQEAFRIMKNQSPPGGRIVNNGSLAAHVPRPHAAAYTATKHAITGLTKSTALDGRKYGIACSQIDIGNAATNMTAKMKSGVLQANLTLAPEPTMDVEHAARAVVHMASLPLDANIQFMTIMATEMPFIGRG